MTAQGRLQGEPYLIYLAAQAGQDERLEALLQDILPASNHLQDLHHSQQDLSKRPYPTAADYLEYVDKQTGFTPLLAAVRYHRGQCAKLLLEHGADVHNHGSKSYQTPLRMAVTDLNMDVGMVDLLVSYGASPFLEAKDGMTPMDEVVQLRHHRVGPMPYALGSVLLCLRRRCAFRGHLELKVERYLGLSHTWRKFFCVLSPREKVPGCAVDMQLLVFSKNGFDPVTSVLMTDAALIEVPMKAAHGRACYELALSNRQQRKPAKLFAPGSSRTGFSIYVRALSKDLVEARWLRKFASLATSEPNLAMLNGDGEAPTPFRRSLEKAAFTAPAEKPSQLQPVVQAGNSRRCNTSFSSDSAHLLLTPQSHSPEATDAPAHMHSKSSAAAAATQRIPTISPIATPNGIPAQAPAPPTRKHSSPAQAQQDPAAQYPANGPANQAASQSSSFSSSLQQLSSAAPSEVGSSASPVASNSGEVWRSNPTYGLVSSSGFHLSSSGLNHTISGLKASSGGLKASSGGGMPSSYRASQSLPSFKAFTAVDRRLTDSWRAKLLDELDDDSDSEVGADMRTTLLPVVSEHDSLPSSMQEWGLQSEGDQKQAALHSAPHAPLARFQLSSESSAAGTAATAQSHPSHAAPSSSHAWLPGAAPPQDPTATNSSHMTHMTQPARASPQSNQSMRPDTALQLPRQPQQHHQTDTAMALHPQQDPSQAQSAADAQAAGNTAVVQQHGHSLPVCMSPGSLLSQSSLEVVRARSSLLDIPSAELLDSILDFANAVCGDQQNDTAYSPLKDAQDSASAWASPLTRARSEPAERRPAAFSTISRASMTESMEPFSDDDDITILDTTEVKKLSPGGLPPLPEGALPPPRTARRQVVNPNHFDSRDEEDLVFEMQRVTLHDAPFQHYNTAPHMAEQNSPSSAARYGHMNRMYDTSTSDVSSPGGHAANQGRRALSPSHQTQAEYASQPQSSIYDSSGSHSMVEPELQMYHDVIEQTDVVPQMEAFEFREMIDGIMAHSEQQAAQLHMTGGAASTSSALHPIWEDEETCLEGHGSPCVATIGMPAS